MKIPCIILLISLINIGGCACNNDIRDLMLKSAQTLDKEFPDEKSLKLTGFSYIGKMNIKEQKVLVVYASSVIPNMPAPRGNSWIYLFSDSGKLLERKTVESHPLWCEGSIIYFYGKQNGGEDEGNALDFSNGINKERYKYIASAGSWLP